MIQLLPLCVIPVPRTAHKSGLRHGRDMAATARNDTAKQTDAKGVSTKMVHTVRTKHRPYLYCMGLNIHQYCDFVFKIAIAPCTLHVPQNDIGSDLGFYSHPGVDRT